MTKKAKSFAELDHAASNMKPGKVRYTSNIDEEPDMVAEVKIEIGGDGTENTPVKKAPAKKKAVKKAAKKAPAKKKPVAKKKPAAKPKPEPKPVEVSEEHEINFKAACEFLYGIFKQCGQKVELEDLTANPALKVAADNNTFLKIGIPALFAKIKERQMSYTSGDPETLMDTERRKRPYRTWVCPSCETENDTTNDDFKGRGEQCNGCGNGFVDVTPFVIAEHTPGE